MIDKSGIDIVAVISEHIQLKRHGRNYFGLCPFHHEKTPSFSVSPSKQIFHCFGCHESGDAIDFIQKISGVSFQEAYHQLKGHTLPAVSSRQAERIKYERAIQREFDNWRRQYADECALIMRCANKLIDARQPGYTSLYLQAQVAEYHLNIIIDGDKTKILTLRQEVVNGRFNKNANGRGYSNPTGGMGTFGTRRVLPPRRCRAVRVYPKR